MTHRLKQLLAAFVLSLATTAIAQPPDAAALLAAQREAMGALAKMDGAWRGPAWTLQPNGQKRHITQTERIGPFLGGALKVIEGRGYEDDGRVTFNSFGIVSYDPAKKAYLMRSYALGRYGDFPLVPLPDGYAWEVPAGPGAVVKYRATIKDGTLREVGDRHAGDAPPVRVFEMELKRIGDSDWPAGNPIPQR